MELLDKQVSDVKLLQIILQEFIKYIKIYETYEFRQCNDDNITSFVSSVLCNSVSPVRSSKYVAHSKTSMRNADFRALYSFKT